MPPPWFIHILVEALSFIYLLLVQVVFAMRFLFVFELYLNIILNTILFFVLRRPPPSFLLGIFTWFRRFIFLWYCRKKSYSPSRFGQSLLTSLLEIVRMLLRFRIIVLIYQFLVNLLLNRLFG